MPASAAIAATAPHGWHSRAVTAPPGAAKDPQAGLQGIACRSATNCLTGGFYQDKAGDLLPMVASESDGRWARATVLQLPADAAPNPEAEVGDVACWAVGSCIAIGDYETGTMSLGLGFVATESKGAWAQATVLPLPANAAASPGADFYSAACPSRGSCVVVGSYQDSAGNPLPVVDTESHGQWSQAAEISLPRGAVGAQLISVSCDSARMCATVGSYIPRTGADQGMLVTESDGVWHQSTRVRAPAGVEQKLGNFLTGVSCWLDLCLAVGGYSAANGELRPIAVPYVSGGWGRAITLPAVPGGAGGHSMAQLVSVACNRDGCTAVGSYFGGGLGMVPIAAAESGGRWDKPVVVPQPAGHAAGAQSSAFLHGVACNGRTCTAVGFFLRTGASSFGLVSTYR